MQEKFQSGLMGGIGAHLNWAINSMQLSCLISVVCRGQSPDLLIFASSILVTPAYTNKATAEMNPIAAK